MSEKHPLSLIPSLSVHGPNCATTTRERLAATLVIEDIAEERDGLSPHDRLTCPLHRRWVYQCASSPSHAIPVTGHCWCRDCQVPVTVAVDELACSIELTCPRCHRFPNTAANRQVLRSCRASIGIARKDQTPAVPNLLQRRAS